MSITVCHGGDPIPKSPFHISVAPLLDLSKVSVQGLNSSEYIDANTEANVSYDSGQRPQEAAKRAEMFPRR